MRPFYLIILTVVLYSTLLGALPALCQKAPKVVLTGTVSDAIDNSAVDGADVAVHNPTGVITKVITGSDGKYKVPSLNSGDTVIIYYAHAGYLPHPSGPVAVILIKGKNTKNLQLMEDSKNASYWSTWANRVKSSADASTPDAEKRSVQYNQFWSSLNAFGFSSVGQALAAREIADATPEATHSPQLMSFAAVDLDKLQQADSAISSAAEGQGGLSSTYSIPPDVAVAIAARELKKAGASSSYQADFMKNFEEVWGKGATNDLSKTLSTPPEKYDLPKMWSRPQSMENKPKLE